MSAPAIVQDFASFDVMPFSADIALEVISRVRSGISLIEVCEDENLPNWNQVHRWAQEDYSFAEELDVAQRAFGQKLAIEALRCADLLGKSVSEAREDITREMASTGATLEEILVARSEITKESIATARIKIDVLKWLAPRVDKALSEKVETSVNGSVKHDHEHKHAHFDLSSLTVEELRQFQSIQKRLVSGENSDEG